MKYLKENCWWCSDKHFSLKYFLNFERSDHIFQTASGHSKDLGPAYK